MTTIPIFSFLFLFISFFFKQTHQAINDPIYFYPEMILSWYKDMEVDMKDVKSFTEGETYTFGFALNRYVPVLICRKNWKFNSTTRMQFTNINGAVCSDFASGNDYYFAVSRRCVSDICIAEVFTYATVKVVEEDGFQSLLLNHFKHDGVNYMFPKYEIISNYAEVNEELEIKYSYDLKKFEVKHWSVNNNIDIETILPELSIGDTISIVIFNQNRSIVFAAKECHVVDKPKLVTSRYHVAKGYEHKIKFMFDIKGMEVFDVVVKSGGVVIGNKTKNDNVDYVEVNVDELKTGIHDDITFTYNHKMQYSGTTTFSINVYDDPNKDIVTLNNDFYSCHYIKKDKFVFTGKFRDDVNINEQSPLKVSASIRRNTSLSYQNISIIFDEANQLAFTISLEEETLNNIGDIYLYIYENGDTTYPIYSNTITVIQPTLANDYQTYIDNKQGNLLFNDLICTLKNITLTSTIDSTHVINVDCSMSETNEIICPYTLLKGYDLFNVSVDGYFIGNVNIMRELKSTIFQIEKQNCYLLSKDNKIIIYTDEYNMKYITNLTLSQNEKNIIVNTTSNYITYRYNNMKNEIIITLYTDEPGSFNIKYVTDVFGNNSTFKFEDIYTIVETHFTIKKNYLLKSNFFDAFNALLEFDLNLNTSDYINVVYLDDANVTCNNTSNSIEKNILNCTFDVATLFAPRDFKIKLKCSEDLYTSPQVFSIYRYELSDSELCQTKDNNIQDLNIKIYTASSLPENSTFNVNLKKKN